MGSRFEDSYGVGWRETEGGDVVVPDDLDESANRREAVEGALEFAVRDYSEIKPGSIKESLERQAAQREDAVRVQGDIAYSKLLEFVMQGWEYVLQVEFVAGGTEDLGSEGRERITNALMQALVAEGLTPLAAKVEPRWEPAPPAEKDEDGSE